MSHSLVKSALISLLLIGSGQILAKENCGDTKHSPTSETESHQDNSSQSECVEVGQWQFGFSVGLGSRTNPLIDSDNVPLIFLPTISYYGENFFIDNLDIGYSLYDSEKWTVNILTSPALDSVYFDRWDIGNFFIDLASGTGASAAPPDVGSGSDSEDNFAEVSTFDLEERDISWLGGLEIFHETESGSLLQFSILKDIVDVHGGTEARFAWAIPLNKTWSTTLGLTWKDAKMTNYYYGLEEREITDDRATYTASSSINPFVRLSWLEESNSNSAWRFNLEYQKFGKGISNSPLLDSDSTLTIFVGKQFNF